MSLLPLDRTNNNNDDDINNRVITKKTALLLSLLIFFIVIFRFLELLFYIPTDPDKLLDSKLAMLGQQK